MFCTHLARIDTWEQHAIERYLTIAEYLGLGRSPVDFVFATDATDRDYVDTLLPAGERFAVLLPATHRETKRWPIERFAAMVKPIEDRFGLKTILAGGPDAAALASAIPGALNLAGKTTLRQLVALLERADLVIANDTGPMHIASALGRPLVTMFGPTSPLQTGPYGRMESVVRLDMPCSPCFSRQCSHQSCLRQLQVGPVLELAAEQLRKNVQISNLKSQIHNFTFQISNQSP
jgi:ADP-heptose:LPS heptosyltransferase